MTDIKIEEITEILNRPRGASVTYHVGLLACDRDLDVDAVMPMTERERQALHDTAVLAMRFQDQGKVQLVQRRIASHKYQYIAQRC